LVLNRPLSGQDADMLDAGAPPREPAARPLERRSDARFGARALLAGLAIALVAVPFGLLLILVQARWSPLLEVDDGARDALHEVAVDHAGFVTAMQALSTIGSASVYLTLFALVALWLTARRLPRLALFVVVTMLGSWLLNSLVKLAVDRARPVLPDPVAHAGGMSFPSGHAQSATVAAAVLLLVFLPLLRDRAAARRIAVGAAAALVLAIGFSRVALGVHYVSDVLAGYVLGAAWVAAMTAAFSAWRRERGRPPVDPALGLEPEEAGRLGVGGPSAGR
jgi:membrane-associated phospholipid phosphatase